MVALLGSARLCPAHDTLTQSKINKKAPPHTQQQQPQIWQSCALSQMQPVGWKPQHWLASFSGDWNTRAPEHQGSSRSEIQTALRLSAALLRQTIHIWASDFLKKQNINLYQICNRSSIYFSSQHRMFWAGVSPLPFRVLFLFPPRSSLHPRPEMLLC